MSDLVELLSQFNRKERFFLVGQVLGNKGFSLAASFREKLGDVIGVEIPRDAFVGMDYHLDWIAASLWAYRKPELVGKPFPNSDQVATGTQQDIDLLIAFEAEDHYYLVLLEAKGYDSWTNKQMCEKSQRLKGIFGCDGKKQPKVKPSFCLTSPRKPERLETKSWPIWIRKDGGDSYYWLELNLEYPRLQITRCDSNGNSLEGGNHFCIKKVQKPFRARKPSGQRWPYTNVS